MDMVSVHRGRETVRVVRARALTDISGQTPAAIRARAPKHGGRRTTMPRGDKSKYTDKQKRKAEHIEESYEKRGTPKKEAEQRAWATVNKTSGGGKKSGSGRGKKED